MVDFDEDINIVPPKEIRSLARFLQDRKNGIFVDVGTGEGDIFDRSFYLEKELEWTGICIEPRPERYSLLIKNRKSKCLQICIDKFNGGTNFQYSNFEDDFESERSRKITVSCSRLTEVCLQNSIKIIDYLTINTNKKIVDIILGIDFSKIRINIIVLDRSSAEIEAQIENGLAKIGYAVYYKDSLFWTLIFRKPQFTFANK